MALPNKIIDRKAKNQQGWMIIVGILTAFMSYGAFSSNDAGWGFILALISFVLLYGAVKMRTEYVKNSSATVGRYNKI